MTVSQRLKIAIAWVKTKWNVKTQEQVGFLIGYKNKSYISQAVNGKIPAEEFIRTLCNKEPELSYDWIMKGDGEMLIVEAKHRDYQLPTEEIMELKDELLKIYKRSGELLEENSRLRMEIEELKKQRN